MTTNQRVELDERCPAWVSEVDQARRGGDIGAILTFVTNDRVLFPELGPPLLLKYSIAAYFASKGHSVLGFSLASGIENLNASGKNVDGRLPTGRDPVEVLSALTPMLRDPDRNLTLILDYADHIVPASQGMGSLLSPQHASALELIHGWGADERIKRSGNVVLLISHENQVHELLRKAGSGFRLIKVDLPNERSRKGFTQYLLDQRDSGRAEFGGLDPSMGIDGFTSLTSGLRLTDIEALLRIAGSLSIDVNTEMVSQRKSRAIKELAEDLLEIHEPRQGGFSSVAGLEHATSFFRDRMSVGALPPGVILAGVPGVGKSYIVGAVAKEMGLPCLAMRNVRERWVGASERNLELVLWVAETLAPCVMWIDEIDQVIGQRSTGGSTDSGTSERMLSRIWEFMGDTSKRRGIVWIGTTNRPDLLDAATLDRFPVLIPFIHPVAKEVAALLPVLAEQLGRTLADDVDVFEVAAVKSLQLVTVRNLLEILQTASAWTDLDNDSPGSPIDADHLIAAAGDYKPNYNPLLHEFIALKALSMTNFQSLLPWRSRSGKRGDAELLPYLDGLLADDGLLESYALDKKLEQLGQQLFGQQLMRQI